MLADIGGVRQQDPQLRRRWFRDDYFDIFTWQKNDEADGTIVGFQLCYDLPNYERVLSWRVSQGYSHQRVDGGEVSPFKNMTPILVSDGLMPFTDVLTEFDQRAVTLEPALRAFLRERLLDYAASDAMKIDKPSVGA